MLYSTLQPHSYLILLHQSFLLLIILAMPILIHSVLVIALLFNPYRLLLVENKLIMMILILECWLIVCLLIILWTNQLFSNFQQLIVLLLLAIFWGYARVVPTVSNHICCIVGLLSLHRTIFTLMHATPVAGHMDKYKTLYRIKLRFLASVTFRCSGLDETMRPLYAHQSLATSRTRINVLLASQFSLRHPSCKPMDARSLYRTQWLYGTYEHYVWYEPVCGCCSCY